MDGKDKSCLRMHERPKRCLLLGTQRSQASAAFWKLQWERHRLSLISKHLQIRSSWHFYKD